MSIAHHACPPPFPDRTMILTCREFSRILGRSPRWVRGCIADGYYYEFGISSIVINRGRFNQQWYVVVPEAFL